MFSSQVSQALRVLIGIVRLQKGPEDLPYSVRLLVVTVVAASLLDLFTLAIAPLPSEVAAGISAPPIIIISTVVTILWFAGLLRLAGKSERAVQTLMAVFGFQIVLAPALLLVAWCAARYQADASMQFWVLFLRSAVGIWVLVILARILRAATQWPMFTCVVLSVSYDLVNTLLFLSLVSPAPGAS